MRGGGGEKRCRGTVEEVRREERFGRVGGGGREEREGEERG